MNNILFIKSSLNGEQSKSTQLANQLVSNLAANSQANSQANAQVVERDLNTDALAHLTQAEMGAWMTDENDRSEEQQALANVSDSLIGEVQHADTLVVAIPMYNFGVPSNFKAWADRIARAGLTFKYTENGPVGLLENKKVYIVATRGGQYQGTPKDSQTQFLKDFFAFVGLTDVEFIYAEGLNMADGEASFNSAKESINQLKAA